MSQEEEEAIVIFRPRKVFDGTEFEDEMNDDSDSDYILDSDDSDGDQDFNGDKEPIGDKEPVGDKELVGDKEPVGEPVNNIEVKRGRGRPKGSKNKSTVNKLTPNKSTPTPNTSTPRQKSTPKPKSKKTIPAAIDLPAIPAFERFKHTKPFFSTPKHSIPDQLGEAPSRIGIFCQFFSDTMLKTIVINTNYYAAWKDAGDSGRPWKLLTIPELLVFLAICIYFGVFRAGRDLDWCWTTTDIRKPVHSILQHMSLLRFQQIKRFLHVSIHSTEKGDYYAKVEPLLSHIRTTSQSIYRPSSNVSVDEMVIRFKGRSLHTFRFPDKPIKQGFKIMALCDRGYTWTFLPTSRVAPNKEVKMIDGLSKTASTVIYLVEQLPFKTQAFDVYMDNYFTSIPLFKYLRDREIGACGTAKIISRDFPKQLKIDKKTDLDWSTTSGVVVDDVLAMLWIDNGRVTMLTTVHELVGAEWKIERNRRRPRITANNATQVRQTWGNNGRKDVVIPKVIDDYNYHMGGVDIADQRRSYYHTQITTRRTWMPLFFWLLDTAIINSYLVYQTTESKMTQVDFRLNLAWDLIKLADEKENGEPHKTRQQTQREQTLPNPPRKPNITKHSHDLDIIRLTPGAHLPIHQEKREACIWCRHLGKIERIKINSQNPPQSNIVCQTCNVALCINNHRNCYAEYHIKKD